MATDDSVRERIRSKSTILGDIRRAPAREPAPEADDDDAAEPSEEDTDGHAPAAGSAYDAPYGRPENKPVPVLRFIYGDTIRALPYANLDSIDLMPADKPGGGPFIILRYNGIAAREARIDGRNLDLLYNLLSEFRVAWVRELPKGRDFIRDNNATVITGLKIDIIKKLTA